MYCDKAGLLETQKGEIFFHWNQERHSDGGVLLSPRRVGGSISKTSTWQRMIKLPWRQRVTGEFLDSMVCVRKR